MLKEIQNGDRLILARTISQVEKRDASLESILAEVYPHTGRAQVWGITGPPGAGKSTLVDSLVMGLRKKNKKVAVIAVDPSSPFTGGAVLGDRIRMQRHTGDENVYIRSLGTRGKHGGISVSSREVIHVLDAAGFDVILVETAGVGQTELDILKVAQTIVVVLVPESGDSIQVMKAGIMEIADIFAVNKSDRPEADRMVKELINMVGLMPHDADTWFMPVLKTEAPRDIGTDSLLAEIEKHQAYLESSGKKRERRIQFLTEEIQDLITERAKKKTQQELTSKEGREILEKLLNKEIDPFKAAALIQPALK